MRTLITGGAGFIGSHLAEHLVSCGHQVRIFDNLSTGKIDNLDRIRADVDFICGDVCDKNAISKAVQKIDVLFHLAALPSVQRSVENPSATHETNATGTLNVLLASKELNVGKVVFASSSSVYGDTPVLPKVETMPPNPKSPYALSKFYGERMCQLFYKIWGLNAIALRYFNIFGPRQNPNSPYSGVISKFCQAAKENELVTIYGDGKQTRDFTYVSNAVQATFLASQCDMVAGEVINVACGQQKSLLDLVELLREISGNPMPIRFLPPRKGDVHDSLADISKARELLDYDPAILLMHGLTLTYQELR